MKRWLCMFLIAGFALAAAASSAAPFTLVKDGKPACSIVIAEKANGNARVGAQELQKYVEKISGAKLAIYTDADNLRAAREC